MKQNKEGNKLCVSCRRTCKQPAVVVIAVCPRYYAKPLIAKNNWRQEEFTFTSE